MWEFEVRDLETEEIFIIYGYNIFDACERNDLDIDMIEVLMQEYVD